MSDAVDPRTRLLVAATSFAVLALATSRAFAVEPVTADRIINTFEDTFDLHPGQLASRANTVCVQGEFVGTSAASALSRSRLFGGHPITVVGRFSLVGGNASGRRAREMALEFRLPDGSLQHMAMLDTPVFVAAQPLTFNEMIKAVKPDPSTGQPDEGRLRDFLDSHPDAFAQWNFLAATDPAPSYADSAYFSMHTFRFIDADGRTHFVRWRFVPADGKKWIRPSQAVWTYGSLMEGRLTEQLRRGPVRWDMIVFVGEPDDTTDNASIAWPESRRHFKAGTLWITRASPESGADCQKAGFDPLIVADGIALTDDPILLFRSRTYASAFVGRLSQTLGSVQVSVVDRQD